MARICKCDKGFSNTGVPSCVKLLDVAYKLVAVNYRDSEGNVNSIKSTDVLDQAFIDAKINEADASKRWYPLPVMEEVEDVRADAVTQEFDSGSTYFKRLGKRSFSAFFPEQPTEYADKLDSIGCGDVGIFIIDENGAIQGNGKVAGELYPIKVNKGSWYADYRKSTYTDIPGVQLKFELALTERDGDLSQIVGDEYTGDLLSAIGLLDVAYNVSSVTATELVVELTTCFGSVFNKDAVKVVLADFALLNVTTSTAVVIDSVVENPNGTYTVAYSAGVSSTDILALTVTKSGFDFSVLAGESLTVA